MEHRSANRQWGHHVQQIVPVHEPSQAPGDTTMQHAFNVDQAPQEHAPVTKADPADNLANVPAQCPDVLMWHTPGAPEEKVPRMCPWRALQIASGWCDE